MKGSCMESNPHHHPTLVLWHPSIIYKALINAGASIRRERVRPTRREAAQTSTYRAPVSRADIARSTRLLITHLLAKKRGAPMPPSKMREFTRRTKVRKQGANLRVTVQYIKLRRPRERGRLTKWHRGVWQYAPGGTAHAPKNL